MEEPINKKNIIFLFFTLIVIFLFFYKGVILSADQYLEEYNNYRNSTARQNISSLRKGNLNTATNSGSSSSVNSNLQKKLFQVLQDFEDMKLNLSSSLHSIKTNQNELEEKLEKLITTQTDNQIENQSQSQNTQLINTLKEILKDLKTTKYKDGINSLETISDNLNSNLDMLRTSINEK
jgi:hypothetical protein